jgi:type III restriction enzyme
MMSFRRAVDYTYIAQLLGRMIRTPLQQRVTVDETLNEVHLYLPQFDESTVYDVVDALKSTEGATIPTDIEVEEVDSDSYETLVLKPTYQEKPRKPGQPAQKKAIPGQLEMNFENPDTLVEKPSNQATQQQASYVAAKPNDNQGEAVRVQDTPMAHDDVETNKQDDNIVTLFRVKTFSYG